jgi:outer membrane lipoprotein-sorting protein
MTIKMTKRIAWAGLALCLSLLGGTSEAADLETVLANFDAVQTSVQTLSAEFTETTVSQLLKDPMVAEGRLYMTKPDSIRWEYVQPEEMRFVIYGDEYTGYFPARKSAEKRSVRRWSQRIFRFIGLGQASTELRKLYDIRLEQPGEGDEQVGDTYLLVFEPKKRRVKRRVDDVRFWVDKSSYLPKRVEYRSANGNTRVVEFHEILINPDLAASMYTVELPEDVTVTKGFGSLPGLGGN